MNLTNTNKTKHNSTVLAKSSQVLGSAFNFTGQIKTAILCAVLLFDAPSMVGVMGTLRNGNITKCAVVPVKQSANPVALATLYRCLAALGGSVFSLTKPEFQNV